MIINPDAIAFANPEYNGFKNNDYQVGTITVSGTVAPAPANAIFSTTFNLQRQDSVVQLYLTTNRTSDPPFYTSGETYQLPTVIDYNDGTTVTDPGTAGYGIIFTVTYTSTQITVTATIPNPYAEDLSGIDATYTIEAYTFIAPFVS